MISRPTIAVLGASGLIGGAVALGLIRQGFSVVAVARRFTPAQAWAFGHAAVTAPVVDMSRAKLAETLAGWQADVVVNCIGVLQDGPKGKTGEVHSAFIQRLLAAMDAAIEPALLVHLSMPGRDEDDRTQFSRSKREGERLIAGGPVRYVILRPGFVIAPAAYGGSAMIRALAALPLGLPDEQNARPFAVSDVADITATIAHVATRWHEGDRAFAESWDVLERESATFGQVVESFRRHFGGPRAVANLPGWLMSIGARAGDLVSRLGWTPPIRTTALAEIRRGVEGDPAPWIAATGIEPRSLAEAVTRLEANVQASWFARLYLLKALVFGILALFWIVSGLIPLTVSFGAAALVFTTAGFPQGLANAITAATSFADVAIGLAIAWRPWSRAGLLAGIALSLAYVAGSLVLTPALWLDPVGPLVKTIPAIVLMLVALAIRDDR
ncbi:nucleoside-diphosphate sugar epimerase [Agaricicola taiwanensis]|uniref:Nucleoside-diphosphate sugar epimerase n=1 Tax=Agaricicola taiwanensis TaxID=591372 RepID=A0A8J2VNZ3_9RHOB|nr:SDR family oxidoreductase [Agaricicola taiwanensis]GGE34255.1 nucleoside-diphosphate sugar epimerase [Agaricicola taiwanensis]